MSYEVTFAGKSGPSLQTLISGSSITKSQGCYLNPADSKYYSVDSNSNLIFHKTATEFSIKFYLAVAEDAELPATPNTELVLDSTDFFIKAAGSNILQASAIGGGGGVETFADGSAAAPTINFSAETNSGFYRIGSNNIGFSIAGVKKYGFEIPRHVFWSDNDGSTAFGQMNILGRTNTNKYLALGFNTTANYGMIEAGLSGTGYYNLVLNENAGSNVLLGTVSNTYSTRLFVEGTCGANAGLILNDGSVGTPALRFTGALDTGVYFVSSDVRFSVGGVDALEVGAADVTTPNCRIKSDNANTIELETVSALGSSYSITMPAALPTVNKVLTKIDTSTYNFIDPFFGKFGNGSDGDVTISGTVTLTDMMYYNNLTVSAGNILNCANNKIFISGTLTFDSLTAAGGIFSNGGAASGSVAGAAAVAGVYTISGAGSAGGAGGTTTGTQAAAPGTVANSVGGTGGTGRPGSAGTSGAGGTLRAGGTITNSMLHNRIDSTLYIGSILKLSGGSGGAGGGGGGGNGSAGGAGGGGGGGAGAVVIFARYVEFKGVNVSPIVGAIGGVGGIGTNSPAANRGAGGGGGGGGGGYVLFVCGQIIGTPPADWISVNGGAGGAGGTGVSPTLGAQGGDGGSAGTIYYVCLERKVVFASPATRVVGSVGGANSGQTGGSGAAGGIQTNGSTY